MDAQTLLKITEDMFSKTEFKQLSSGTQIIRYILWTLNAHLNLRAESQNKSSAYWQNDKSAFNKKTDMFVNSNLLTFINAIEHFEDEIRFINGLPNSVQEYNRSTRLTFRIDQDSKTIIQGLQLILKEFQTLDDEHFDSNLAYI